MFYVVNGRTKIIVSEHETMGGAKVSHRARVKRLLKSADRRAAKGQDRWAKELQVDAYSMLVIDKETYNKDTSIMNLLVIVLNGISFLLNLLLIVVAIATNHWHDSLFINATIGFFNLLLCVHFLGKIDYE